MRAARVRLSTHCAMEWQSLFRKGKLNNYCLCMLWGFVVRNGVRKKERHIEWSKGLDCGAFFLLLFRRIKLTCAALGLSYAHTASALTYAIGFAWQIDCDHTHYVRALATAMVHNSNGFVEFATIVCPFWQYQRMWFFKLFSRNNYHRWMHAHWYGHSSTSSATACIRIKTPLLSMPMLCVHSLAVFVMQNIYAWSR